MPQNNNTCLIIAQSGRALTASARIGGWEAHVLDRYKDLDTEGLALSCQSVSGDDDGFHIDALLGKLTQFLKSPVYGVIYGSGLENHYEALDFLYHHWNLLGNEGSVVKACKDPAFFFPALARFGIPYPLTSLVAPQACCGDDHWLIKKIGASGGGHIHTMSTVVQEGQHYYQKKISGRSLSIVFLANSKNVAIVGFNEIWTVAPGKNDFRYAGAITRPDLPGATKQTLEEIVRVLVREIGLQGLCGMDVILDENDQCHVLEINPRPTATFELHQADQNLCNAHMLACAGRLVPLSQHTEIIRAHQVLYADEDIKIPDICWPDWASDRPPPGRHIRNNDPVCMVHAGAACKRDTLALLQRRAEILLQLIGLQKLAA